MAPPPYAPLPLVPLEPHVQLEAPHEGRVAVHALRKRGGPNEAPAPPVHEPGRIVTTPLHDLAVETHMMQHHPQIVGRKWCVIHHITQREQYPRS
jgi:hypothetical protein